MRYLIILSAFVILSEAQRPSYASSGPIGRPGLHSRFKTDNDSSTTTTVVFENRVGEDGSTQKIPVDARGDINLVNTLNSWDRDHRPYWFLNADHIERARNTTRVTQQAGQNQAAQTTQLNNRNQVDSQRNQGVFDVIQGSQGGVQQNQGSFQVNHGQGSFSGGQDSMQGSRGRLPISQHGQTGGQNFQPTRRTSGGFSQGDEYYHGQRHMERPSRFEYRRNFYE